ncbi:hypothetical protein ALQ16_205264 [Pseudomonas syringae pv. actinidiae]|nr:hypothetical protein ALQ16_205264 [Pseudomonas syringae pv. actinidiae]
MINDSLRWRLLWNLALLLVMLMLASGMSAYWNGREVADTAYDRTLLASARTIAAGLTQRDGTLSADIPYVALDTFAYDSEGRIYYQVNDIHQKLISGYENLPSPPPGTLRTDDYPALAKFYNGTYQGQDVRVVSLLKPVTDPGMNGTAEIRVAETQEARKGMARSLMADTLLRLGMLGGGALLLVWFTVSAALRPLERLRTAVEGRQTDDLRSLPMVEVQHELRPLVGALNHFTERLRLQFERQAQFIADAAHELRTPLGSSWGCASRTRNNGAARWSQLRLARIALRIWPINCCRWRALKTVRGQLPKGARSNWTSASWPGNWAWQWHRWPIRVVSRWRWKPTSRSGCVASRPCLTSC